MGHSECLHLDRTIEVWQTRSGYASSTPYRRSLLPGLADLSGRTYRRKTGPPHLLAQKALGDCTPAMTSACFHNTKDGMNLAELHDQVHQRPSRVRIPDIGRLLQ